MTQREPAAGATRDGPGRASSATRAGAEATPPYAELYRQLGRGEEALEIEDELRRYCAYADPDFPLLQELEARERLATAPKG